MKLRRNRKLIIRKKRKKRFPSIKSRLNLLSRGNKRIKRKKRKRKSKLRRRMKRKIKRRSDSWN